MERRSTVPAVAIVTDTCASIPESLLQALMTQWLPYYLHRGSKVLRNRVTMHLSPVLGMHAGPGTAGVCCLPVGAGKP